MKNIEEEIRWVINDKCTGRISIDIHYENTISTPKIRERVRVALKYPVKDGMPRRIEDPIYKIVTNI